MSAYTAKTKLSSILKAYSSTDRDNAKSKILNKVRFEITKKQGLLPAVDAVTENNNYQPLNQFVEFVKKTDLSDDEFVTIYADALKVVVLLNKDYDKLVEVLLSQKWLKRSPEAVVAYKDFFIDVLVAHSKYVPFGIQQLILLFVPALEDAEDWLDGKPSEKLNKQLLIVHKMLERILTIIPMTFDTILNKIESALPYYKRPTYMTVGYLHNVLWLLEYKPNFMEYILEFIIENLLVMLDVSAPRSIIEETEEAETEETTDKDEKPENDKTMKDPIAHTLDICMEKIFEFLHTKNPNEKDLSVFEQQIGRKEAIKFSKQLFTAFDNVILRLHNTHHIQFLVFYYCSFDQLTAQSFLESLWNKIKNPNVSTIIRQAAVGYLSSFLARFKPLPLVVLKHYLKEMSDWAFSYVENAVQQTSTTNRAIKIHILFYTVCQAIFYLITFRSRDLTATRKNLIFLQSLPLAALVTCHLNPLHVCSTDIVTLFAGVMRSHQLVYCYSILGRNARHQLATVDSNGIEETPANLLDTFFPFDPYLLKISGKRIEPLYMQYQPSEVEEYETKAIKIDVSDNIPLVDENKITRKRTESEMLEDLDIDDFVIEKKHRRIT